MLVKSLDAGARSRDDLRRAQAGDARALNRLFRRELPILRTWAQSRVPRALWRQTDADDLVQLTFLRALRRYREFEVRSGASFQHYLRRILTNLTRDEIRRAGRDPGFTDLAPDGLRALQPSSLDLLLGREAQRRFWRAVKDLSPRSRTAVLARLQRGLPYEEIAAMIGAPGAAAARAVVGRGVERVARLMRRPRQTGGKKVR